MQRSPRSRLGCILDITGASSLIRNVSHQMPSPNPIAATNQCSCTLACISWVLSKNSMPISQEDIIHKLGLWFPEWFHRAGLMDRGDILTLFGRLNIPVRKFVHLNAKDESLRLISKYY